MSPRATQGVDEQADERPGGAGAAAVIVAIGGRVGVSSGDGRQRKRGEVREAPTGRRADERAGVVGAMVNGSVVIIAIIVASVVSVGVRSGAGRRCKRDETLEAQVSEQADERARGD